MLQLVSGLIATGFADSALFFLRYWRQTRDGPFAAFAAALELLALGRAEGLEDFVEDVGRHAGP